MTTDIERLDRAERIMRMSSGCFALAMSAEKDRIWSGLTDKDDERWRNAAHRLRRVALTKIEGIVEELDQKAVEAEPTLTPTLTVEVGT